MPILLGEETAATRGTAVGVGLKQTVAVSIAMTDRSRCGSRASGPEAQPHGVPEPRAPAGRRTKGSSTEDGEQRWADDEREVADGMATEGVPWRPWRLRQARPSPPPPPP